MPLSRPSSLGSIPIGPGCRLGRRGLAWPRLLAICLAVCCCLAAGCGDRSGEDKPASVEPGGIFQRRAPAPPKPAVRRLLLIGDSLSISLGEQLERALAGAPGLDFVWDGTKSTGLTRPELLDWPRHLRDLVSQRPPDVVLVMLGTNDTMPVTAPDGGHILFGDSGWDAAYAAKAEELLAICRQANPKVTIYWVGAPTMGEPTLAAGVDRINAALNAMCQADGCRFINTRSAFADDQGRFARQAKDVASGETVAIRTPDGVHLTENGSRLLAGQVLEALTAREHLPAWAAVDELLRRSRDLRPVADPPPPPVRPVVRKPVKTLPHTIRSGETLAEIARRNRIRPEDIEATNPGLDPRRLTVGTVIRIPRYR